MFPTRFTYVNVFTGKVSYWDALSESVWGVTMSMESDRIYHETRARDELERAAEASDPAIARVHRELAALHRRRTIESVGQEGLQLQQMSKAPPQPQKHAS